MSSTPKIRYGIMRKDEFNDCMFEFLESSQSLWTTSLKKARAELKELKEDTYPEDYPEDLTIYKLIVTEVK